MEYNNTTVNNKIYFVRLIKIAFNSYIVDACQKCDPNADCQNNKCVCNAGYTGDGTYCQSKSIKYCFTIMFKLPMLHWGNSNFAPSILAFTGAHLCICNVNSLPLLTNVALEHHVQFVCVWSF